MALFIANDDKPMVKCDVCSCWSHLTCVHLTKRTAAKMQFICYVCKAAKSKLTDSQSPVPLQESSTEADSLKVAIDQLKISMKAQITTLNSHILSLRDECSRISQLADSVMSRLSTVELKVAQLFDKLNYLEQVFQSTDCIVPLTTFLHPMDIPLLPLRPMDVHPLSLLWVGCWRGYMSLRLRFIYGI